MGLEIREVIQRLALPHEGEPKTVFPPVRSEEVETVMMVLRRTTGTSGPQS